MGYHEQHMAWFRSMSFPMTRIARAKLASAVLLLVIPAAGMYAGYYFEKEGLLPTLLGRQRQSGGNESNLFGPPVRNQLDVLFTDADGDLVADPPDPRSQINPQKLILVMPSTGSGEMDVEWKPLLDHLSAATGRPVQMELATIDDMYRLRALRQGEAHLALIGPGAVPIAVNAAGFVPVGMLPTDQGAGVTQSLLIVPAGSPITSPFNLRGADVLFVEPSSNAGFKAAAVALRSDFGLRPGRDFTWRFSGDQRDSIRQIKEKQATVAAVSADAVRAEIAAGRLRSDEYRVIYQSENFPTAAIGYIHMLNVEVAQKLREALLSFDWKKTTLEPVLGSKRTRFIPINYREDWSLLRRIDDATGTTHTIR